MRTRAGTSPHRHAMYTWGVFSTLGGYGSFVETADRGGCWGQPGPELLEHRARQLDPPPRMVFGATTFREVADILVSGDDPLTRDEWNQRTLRAPATVISSTLTETLGRPDATIVRRLKDESDVPLRSQASLSLNRALMAAGVVDRLQVTIFPVVSGRTGTSRIFDGAEDVDLQLLESRALDGPTHELIYRSARH